MSDADIAGIGPPAVHAPRRPLPARAVDCHNHVFGPLDRFPLSTRSVYAIPHSGPEAHRAAREALGFDFGVLVQPAPYGDNPSAMLAALADADGRLSGIAVADATIGDQTLADWAGAGIVGLRFVETRAPDGGRYPGCVGFDALTRLAPRMREHGLHAQLWASADQHVAWLPELAHLGIPLVLDHFGSPAVSRGVDDPAWQRIVAMCADESLWVKLTLCRLFDAGSDYALARPFHDLLLARAPRQLLWGSDWPYVRLDPAPDAGAMLDRFDAWTADPALRAAILVGNPHRLYFPREVFYEGS